MAIIFVGISITLALVGFVYFPVLVAESFDKEMHQSIGARA